MNVIELKNVSKTFYDQAEPTPVLRNISLEIKKGEFVAITGPSGSGKSTLMNILGLLDVPTEGQYLIDSDEISTSDNKLAKLRRQKIGFIFQSYNLIPRLSLTQNVALPMTYAGIKSRARHERALKLLSQVGLGNFVNFKPNQVSGGQAQRAAIARALANKPSLILADEPTGNLDSKTSLQIMEILAKLNKDGATIIVVTHNPEVSVFAHRTITVRDGQITVRKKV